MKNAKPTTKTKTKIELGDLIQKGNSKKVEPSYYAKALEWLFDPTNKPALIEAYSDFLLLDRNGLPTDNYSNDCKKKSNVELTYFD